MQVLSDRLIVWSHQRFGTMKKDEPDVLKVTHASIVVHTVKIPGSVGKFVVQLF